MSEPASCRSPWPSPPRWRRRLLEPAAPEEDKVTVGKVQGRSRCAWTPLGRADPGSPNPSPRTNSAGVWIYERSRAPLDTAELSDRRWDHHLRRRQELALELANQRTLTIIIKYDEEKKVRDFAYNYRRL